MGELIFMNTETWSNIIGSVVRFLLGGLAGTLASKGVITASQGDFIILEISAIAVTAVGLIWAYIKNKTQSQIIQAALAAPAGTRLETAKNQIANQ